MRPLPYQLEFRGVAAELGPRELRIRATAPSSSFVTVVSEAGLSGHVGAFGQDEALLDARLVFVNDQLFDEEGSIVVGRGNRLRFRTVDRARLEHSSDPHLRLAAVVLRIVGGEGQFVEASGRIASNLLLSDTLDVTDNHVGLIHVRQRTTDAREIAE